MSEEERIEEVRRRSEELIRRVDATLADPRPEGPLWQAPQRETVRRRPAPVQQAPASRPGAPPAAPRAWVKRQIDAAIDAIVAGVARYVAGQRQLLEMRHAEAERRLDAAEARIADLERERGR